MKTEKDKVSYIIGQQIGNDFVNQQLDLDIDILTESIKDAFAGKPTKLAADEVQKIMSAFQQKMQGKMQAQMQQIGAENLKAGADFLAENCKKDGVVTLPSGLQYKIITEGTGKSPQATDTVETHYEGKLINGQIFDSSIQRGESISFPVNGVIKGWTEALQLMKEGAKWELFIPGDLAYGEAGSPPVIEPNATLLFTVELITVQ
jgi:FKBP-type peptidyl-prolyl cis-trans isomerase FklB